MSLGGDQTSKFHELCNNQRPTLTLFEIDNGEKGGIYTPLSWDNYSYWQEDMDTFIFNLNKKQKYKKIQKECSIYWNNDYGPLTYYFRFSDDSKRKITNYDSNTNNYFRKGKEILPNSIFNVKEVEVYKII